MDIQMIAAVGVATLPHKGITAKAAPEGAEEFAAIMVEKMLSNLLNTVNRPQGLQQDWWWNMLAEEIARGMVKYSAKHV